MYAPAQPTDRNEDLEDYQRLFGAPQAMLGASGQALEGWAAGRARRATCGPCCNGRRAPPHRYDGQTLRDVPVEDLSPGDTVLVGPGEVVPADGTLISAAVLDESVLTGESLPVERSSVSPRSSRTCTWQPGGASRRCPSSSAADRWRCGLQAMFGATSKRSSRLALQVCVEEGDDAPTGVVGGRLVVAGAWHKLSHDPEQHGRIVPRCVVVV